jgi:hypothetical protein
VDIHDLLVGHRSDVIEEAFSALQRSGTPHYEAAGEELTQDWLGALFDLVVAALRTSELETVGAYCEDIAGRRFDAGFGISEVQTAFNTLEEAMWKRLIAAVPPAEFGEAVRLLSTVLGFGKDALARRYVELASHRHVPALDVSAMFAGTER